MARLLGLPGGREKLMETQPGPSTWSEKQRAAYIYYQEQKVWCNYNSDNNRNNSKGDLFVFLFFVFWLIK